MNLQSRPTERSQLCLCRAGNAVLVRLPIGVPAFLDAFCGGLCVFLYGMAVVVHFSRCAGSGVD